MESNNIIYVYSNVKDFDNNLSNSNINAFKSQLLSDLQISKQCTDVKILGDQVEIWFNDSLTTSEEERLVTIIADKYQDSNIFEIIVDSKGRGQFTSIAEAFAAGKISVFVRDGTYYETQNIIIPDGGRLNGESNVRILLVGNNSIIVDGSNGIKQTVGTISISSASKMVVGVDTNFTALLPGNSIRLGTIYYEIKSIESDTMLTLLETYLGATLTNVDYLAQHMYKGVKISNLVIGYSTAPGIYIRGVRHCGFDTLAIIACTPNIVIVDSGEFSLSKIINGFSKSVGISLTNVTSALFQTLNSFNGSSHGIALQGKNSNVICTSSSFSNHFGSGLMIRDTAYDLHFTNCVFENNNASGIFMQDQPTHVIFQGCTMSHNNGTGITLSGLANVISNCIIKSNVSHGVAASLNSTITNNQIKNNGGSGISCDVNSHNVGISMNQIFNNNQDGVSSHADRGLYTGNTIMQNGGHGYNFTGTNNTISSTSVKQNTLHGVHFSATAHNNMLLNSQILNNTQKGAFIESNGNIIAQNIIFENVINNLEISGVNNESAINKIG